MLLAIDVGNSSTVCGVWSGSAWLAIWRRDTGPDGIAEWLASKFDSDGIPFIVEGAICASVVPALDAAWSEAIGELLKIPLAFLRSGADVGLPVDYDPPSAVGADRIANALGALAKFDPPLIVIDFGTATTFDVVDASGTFVGGAILPGVKLAGDALFAKAAKLPPVPYEAPARAIGKNTVEAMQSGIMLGYAGAIDALAAKMDAELGGGATIVATGGLSGPFVGLCQSIRVHEPTLTIDGLVVAYQRQRRVP